MSEHVCTVCFRLSVEHDPVAADGERYWPPMCCVGCECGTFVAPSPPQLAEDGGR